MRVTVRLQVVDEEAVVHGDDDNLILTEPFHVADGGFRGEPDDRVTLLSRVEPIDTSVVGTQKKIVDVASLAIELLLPVAYQVTGELPGDGIVLIEFPGSEEPDVAVSVFVYIGKSGQDVRFNVCNAADDQPLGVVRTDAAEVASVKMHPHVSVGQYLHGVHFVFVVAEDALEYAVHWIEPVEVTVVVQYPEIAVLVLSQQVDVVARQADGVCRMSPIVGEVDAVEATDAVARGEPHVSAMVLLHGVDSLLRQSVLRTVLGYDVLVLCVCINGQTGAVHQSDKAYKYPSHCRYGFSFQVNDSKVGIKNGLCKKRFINGAIKLRKDDYE